ncbi:MAG: DUF2782 domain-containing protein [Betaproteobacteria bacterium]|nr:DUF2782 domain-containing protein [Betaproteobacteria bacterium]
MKISSLPLFGALSLCLALPAWSQSTARPLPKGSEVVEEVQAPPADKNILAPQPKVTTIKKGTDTIEEYRINGRLYKMKVKPAVGPSYYLVDEKGEGKFSRVDGPEVKIAIPTWVLIEWK